MFGLSKVYVLLGAVILGIFVISLVGYEAYKIGGQVKESEWSQKYNKLVIDTQAATNAELLRQAQANAAAQEHANQLIENLKTKNEGLQNILDQNELEANNDPTTKACGVSKSGVNRLNKIQ